VDENVTLCLSMGEGATRVGLGVGSPPLEEAEEGVAAESPMSNVAEAFLSGALLVVPPRVAGLGMEDALTLSSAAAAAGVGVIAAAAVMGAGAVAVAMESVTMAA